MRIEWSDAAIASARRFIRDQEGLAILALADDPYPAEAFHAGAYHRLRVDSHRVVYFIDGQVITIDRVDRVTCRSPRLGRQLIDRQGGKLPATAGCRRSAARQP